MTVVTGTSILLLVSYIVAVSAIFLRQRQDEVGARKPRIIVTPSRLQFSKFQSASVSCRLGGAHAWYMSMVVLPDLNKKEKFEGGKTVCHIRRKSCRLIFEKFEKKFAVWYACIAYYRNDMNIFVREKGRGAYKLNPKGLRAAGKQFRLDMEPHKSFTNLRVTIEKERDTPIYYNLPQTEIPLLEIHSNATRLYKFVCSTDGDVKDVDEVSLTWKFVPDVTHIKTTSAHKYNKMAPITQLTGNVTRLDVDTSSVQQSHFKITRPSSETNGIYYCEWTTPTTVQRSPAFEIRVKNVLDNSCSNPDVWKSVCHSKQRCFQDRYYFECMCLPGFRKNSGKCEDIDECTNGIAHCPENSECKNTYGMYRCPCVKGYKYHEITRSCIVDLNSYDKEDDTSVAFDFMPDDTAHLTQTKQHPHTHKTVQQRLDPNPMEKAGVKSKTLSVDNDANDVASSQSSRSFNNPNHQHEHSTRANKSLTFNDEYRGGDVNVDDQYQLPSYDEDRVNDSSVTVIGGIVSGLVVTVIVLVVVVCCIKRKRKANKQTRRYSQEEKTFKTSKRSHRKRTSKSEERRPLRERQDPTS
ncbi:uncharacterized protein LOC134190829 isoform X2 [Corticium candelabrum]|uniref:uncharacterized protein LOC134190829 isoform X2 n=1 Tax=Corticium candelabrum TaxID=121492 RepID=UPI002E271A95|nr:uncharacterized protein LOC134190829 isoform X2 [Corticium candelabrum]